MMQFFDPKIVEALDRLLATPDPPDLPHRGHIWRCEGETNRRATRYPHFHAEWLQRHYLEKDGELEP